MRGDGWLDEIARVNFDTNGIADNVVDKLDAIPQPNDLLDFGAGHGTFVAGILQQVDPLARIVVYRALDSDGLASEEAVACAMLRAAEDHVQVISLSIGMQAVDDDDRRCPALHVGSAADHGAREPTRDRRLRRQLRHHRTGLSGGAARSWLPVAALRAEEDPGSGQPLEGTDEMVNAW